MKHNTRYCYLSFALSTRSVLQGAETVGVYMKTTEVSYELIVQSKLLFLIAVADSHLKATGPFNLRK